MGKIPILINKSYYLLYPLLGLPYNNKIMFVSLYNCSDSIDCVFSKRIYVSYEGLSIEDLLSLEKHSLFIKTILIEEDITILSFKIPVKYQTDVELVSIGDYTKTSKDYKQLVINAFKKNDSAQACLKYMLSPTEVDYKNRSKDLLVEDIRAFTSETSTLFNQIEETFYISNFLKLK